MTTMNDDAEIQQHAHLILRFRHRNGDVALIVNKLALPTGQSWGIGDPIGSTSRLRSENFWSHKHVIIDRHFAKAVSDLIDVCWKHRDDVKAFTASGGVVEFYLQLNGLVNSGDRLSTELLTKIVQLGANLDIEVFPAWAVG